MSLTIGSHQWVGARERQEDSLTFATSPDGRALLVLGDGLGGHAGGDTASTLATSIALTALLDPYDTAPTALKNALFRANTAVQDHMQANPETDGMGSTLVCATIEQKQLQWSSVGDSHLYILRGGRVKKLNADHSMKPLLDVLVKEGEITAEQAASDPKRNALRSAILGEELELFEVSKQPYQLENGDIVVVCSDGLDTLGDPGDLNAIVKGATSPDAAAKALVDAVRAIKEPRQDNTSVLVAMIGDRPIITEPLVATHTAPPAPAPTPAAQSGGGVKLMAALAAVFALTTAGLAYSRLGGSQDLTLAQAEAETLATQLDQTQTQLDQTQANLTEAETLLTTAEDQLASAADAPAEIDLLALALEADPRGSTLPSLLDGSESSELRLVTSAILSNLRALTELSAGNSQANESVAQIRAVHLRIVQVLGQAGDPIPALDAFAERNPSNSLGQLALAIADRIDFERANNTDLSPRVAQLEAALNQDRRLLRELGSDLTPEGLTRFIAEQPDTLAAALARAILEHQAPLLEALELAPQAQTDSNN